MKRMIGLLMVLGLVVGCGGDSDSPTGPEGQKLEIYYGVNEDDFAIEYQFYRNGNDMVQHGYYKEFWEEGRIRTSGFYSLGQQDYKTPWKSYDWDGGESPYWPRAILGGGAILSRQLGSCSEQPGYLKSYDSISFLKDLGEGDDEDGKYWMCFLDGYESLDFFGLDLENCSLERSSGGGCFSYVPSYVAIDDKQYDAIRTMYDEYFLVCHDPQKCNDSSDAIDKASPSLAGSVIFTDATYTMKDDEGTQVYPKIDPFPHASTDIWEGIDWDAVPVSDEFEGEVEVGGIVTTEPDGDTAHAEAFGLAIISSGAEIVRYENGLVSGQIDVGRGNETSLLSVRFIAEDGERHNPDPAGDWSLAWEIADESVASVEQRAEDGAWNFRIVGLEEGQTTVIFKIIHGDHFDFVSREVLIDVQQYEVVQEVRLAGSYADQIAILGDPCQTNGPDEEVSLTFFAYGLSEVKQFQIDIKLEPATAFDIEGTIFLAEDPFVDPFPNGVVLVSPTQVQMGAAILGNNVISGDKTLGTLKIRTSQTFGRLVQAQIGVERFSVGPSSRDRDDYIFREIKTNLGVSLNSCNDSSTEPTSG